MLYPTKMFLSEICLLAKLLSRLYVLSLFTAESVST